MLSEPKSNRTENQQGQKRVTKILSRRPYVESENPNLKQNGPRKQTKILSRKTPHEPENLTEKQQAPRKQTKTLKEKSGDTENHYESSNADNRSRKYTTRKGLLVHDPFLKNFDSEQFSKWFDTTNLQFRSVKDILREGSLVSKIRANKPEVVYIHAGFGDLLDKTEGEVLLDQYKQLIYKLLESTDTKVCISMMIPVAGYPQLNSKLRQINTRVSEFISQLRNQHKYLNRVFTSNNDSIGGYIERRVGPKGASITLGERGQKLLWLRVKDSLKRSLGITQFRRRPENETYSRKNTHHE